MGKRGTDNGISPAFTGWQRWALLAGFVVLLVLRLPLAWWHGRLLGEEGTVFLAWAWHRSDAEALGHVFGGYLNLCANAATWAAARLVQAGVLPLEAVPRLTMTVATLFQVIPAVLVLWGRGRWLADWRAVVACLLIIAMAPMTEEVFANVLHIQFHLALACGLILALDIPATRLGRLACWAVLLLAPLCGPGAIVLWPLFGLRALLDRDRGRAMQAMVLGLGAAVQLLGFYTQSPLRGHLLDPLTLANLLLVRIVALPFLSSPVANMLGHQINAARLTGGIGWWAWGALAFVWFAGLLWLALRRADAARWLVLAGLALPVVSFGAGMLPVDPAEWFTTGSSQRYDFLALTLLGMGMVALAMRGDRFSAIAARLSVLMLISGLLSFAYPILDVRDGPDWSRQVALWRQDHDHPLVTWPDKWTVDLSDRDRPCGPPKAFNADGRDPSYCEGAWLRQVRDWARESRRRAGLAEDELTR